jgi:hypothetical protein
MRKEIFCRPPRQPLTGCSLHTAFWFCMKGVHKASMNVLERELWYNREQLTGSGFVPFWGISVESP